MPATSSSNKQRLLTTIFAALKKSYGPRDCEERPVLEQLLYAVLRENASGAAADRAFNNLRDRFFDWNELRVSSVHEVASALTELPQSSVKAQRLIELLQEVFESTYSFELESMQKKGLRQAAKQIARYRASSDFAVAWVVQRSLDGHAIPVDAPTIRTLKRLGLVDECTDNIPALMAGLEHQVPKVKGALFVELVNSLAHDRCGEQPRCSGCPLKSECPSAVLRPEPARAAARPKSR